MHWHLHCVILQPILDLQSTHRLLPALLDPAAMAPAQSKASAASPPETMSPSGRAPLMMSNPLLNHDTSKPLTKNDLAAYSAWLAAVAEYPLDENCVHSICAHCRYKDLGIVAARDLLHKVFTALMLLTEKYIHPSEVGFDPLNRDEFGGSWGAVHSLLSTIKRSGWSDRETQHATCVQTIPNNTEVEDWNIRLVDDVPLAPIKKGQLKYSSLSCGHTNSGLNAVEAECPNGDPRISIGGKLNKAHIGKTDRAFAVAVDRGLKWTVLHYSVRTLYPEALVILISAENVYGSVQQKTSQVQGLLQIHRLCKQRVIVAKIPIGSKSKAQSSKANPPSPLTSITFVHSSLPKRGKATM